MLRHKCCDFTPLSRVVPGVPLSGMVKCFVSQPRPAAGDGWAASIMVAEELPLHLIQPVAEARTADTRCLVSKRTRQRVCHEWFKVAMVPAQFE